MQALHTAATGMLAQQQRTEVISNNLANMNTTGFQRSKTEFNDLLYRTAPRRDTFSSRAGDIVPGGVHLGRGVQLASIYRINEQGSLRKTDNAFDLAIQGRGFFQIQLPNGANGYTRNGTFQLDANGQIVTNDGFPVGPGVNIPAGAIDVTINANGEVLVQFAGEAEPANVGALQLANFANEGGLKAEGDNLFTETTESGPATVSNPGAPGLGSLVQGYVETSNVNPIQEIAALIKAQRAYEINAKMIQTVDQMMAPSQ